MQEVIDKVKQFADAIKDRVAVELVILQRGFKGEEDRLDRPIDVAVVVDFLEEDEDYIEVREQFEKTAKQVDPRIELDLIESDKDDPTGFVEEIRKTGKVIYENL
jgi:hypothetical protein